MQPNVGFHTNVGQALLDAQNNATYSKGYAAGFDHAQEKLQHMQGRINMLELLRDSLEFENEAMREFIQKQHGSMVLDEVLKGPDIPL